MTPWGGRIDGCARVCAPTTRAGNTRSSCRACRCIAAAALQCCLTDSFVAVCRVLVGAPEAQTGQPGVSRGGAVYRCDIRGADHCQEIPFDRTGKCQESAQRVQSEELVSLPAQRGGGHSGHSSAAGFSLLLAPGQPMSSAHPNTRRTG